MRGVAGNGHPYRDRSEPRKLPIKHAAEVLHNPGTCVARSPNLALTTMVITATDDDTMKAAFVQSPNSAQKPPLY